MGADYMAKERSAYVSNTSSGGLGLGGARRECSATLDREYLPTCQPAKHFSLAPLMAQNKKPTREYELRVIITRGLAKSVLVRLQQQQRRNVIESKCRGVGEGGRGINSGGDIPSWTR